MKKILLLFLVLGYGSLKSQVIDASTINAEQFAGFCKVWGLAKFYHSDVTRQKIDWDNVLIKNYPLFIQNQSFESYNKNISQLLDTLSKRKDHRIADNTLLNYIVTDKINLLNNFSFLTDTTKYYNLVSFSWINDSIFSIENKLRISEILINYRPHKSKKLKGRTRLKHIENKYEKLDTITEPYRILSLFRYWNIINYYFPYKNLADKNWNEILERAIKFTE